MGILIKDILAVLPGGTSRKCTVCIEGARILSVDGEPEGFRAEKVIDGAQKLMVPGLVNAHAHAYMTPFRNWADDLDFNTWLFKKIMPMEDALTREDAYWGAVLACMEMIKGGITCFLDMHMFPGSSARAALDTGLRAVISRGLSGGTEDPEGGRRRLREALEEIREFSGPPTLSFMLAPHAPYTCDEGYLRSIAEKARELGLGINTHLSESLGEVEDVENKYGCSPVEFYDRCGLLGNSTVAAHCVHLSSEDMDLLARRGVSVAINHASNLKLANGIAPVSELQKRGVNLCLGTDSAASNNSLSVLRELSLVTLLHKGVNGDPLAVTAAEGFEMATANGARALGLGGKTGEIRPGFLADLAIFDLEQPGIAPLGDPVAALAYSGAGLSAHTVIVNGRIVLESGEFTTVDPRRVYFEVERTCARLGIS
ncbi:MAG: amidohydrolase [Oscillospiraceae bacterium]|jgi:5-methylthioadenosine/S-adenosylhomocysteine deaminase